ncbi:helix-turn-helix domain-containing protein [Herbaspirillum sp. GW103]|uniref:helix-turn-helix domain-containing protein n=1 Tax=Herbaspirillum sp. GW103 TaxID=1175306 RepID=UPI0005588570|nr:helix-turn-helix domain-containing protein [Herbaspirillum sp. GW103]
MHTNDYLELVKRKLDLPSDYALAKVLGVTRSAISHMKMGKSGIGDETAVKVAELTGIPVARVLIDVHLERSKAPEVKAAWASMMEKFSASFDALMPRRSPRLA